MNEKGIGFLKVDLVIQRIIGVVYIVSAVIGVFVNSLLMVALTAQLFLGSWQVLSGIILTIVRKDEWRVKYVLGVAAYVLLSIVFAFIFENYSFMVALPFYLIWYLLIPLSIAIWYYRKTVNAYETLKGSRYKRDIEYGGEMEHILDSEEWVKG